MSGSHAAPRPRSRWRRRVLGVPLVAWVALFAMGGVALAATIFARAGITGSLSSQAFTATYVSTGTGQGFGGQEPATAPTVNLPENATATITSGSLSLAPGSTPILVGGSFYVDTWIKANGREGGLIGLTGTMPAGWKVELSRFGGAGLPTCHTVIDPTKPIAVRLVFTSLPTSAGGVASLSSANLGVNFGALAANTGKLTGSTATAADYHDGVAPACSAASFVLTGA